MGEAVERWLAGSPGVALLAVLAAVSAADIATTQAALTRGAQELSPLGRYVVDQGVVAMTLVKLAAVAAVGLPDWYGRRICLTGLAVMTTAAVLSNTAQLAGLA